MVNDWRFRWFTETDTMDPEFPFGQVQVKSHLHRHFDYFFIILLYFSIYLTFFCIFFKLILFSTHVISQEEGYIETVQSVTILHEELACNYQGPQFENM